MAYEMVMPYHLHMPSYFLETFTEYPYQVSIVRVKVRDLRKSSAYSSADIFPPQSPS